MTTDDIKFGLLRATVMFVHETIRLMKMCRMNGVSGAKLKSAKLRTITIIQEM